MQDIHKQPTLMLVAGGTAGHILPAFHIGAYAKKNGWNVIWISGKDGVENTIKKPNFIKHERIEMAGFRGKSIFSQCKILCMLVSACFQAYRFIHQYQPDVVLCMGGYVSVPTGIAAWLKRLPLCLHESNTRLGLSNRLLLPLSKYCFLGFDLPSLPPKAQITGNPISPDIKRNMLALPQSFSKKKTLTHTCHRRQQRSKKNT